METSSQPPPIPRPQKSNRALLIFGIVMAIVLVLFFAGIAFGLAAFRRAKEKREAAREAYSQVAKTADEEREKVAGLVQSGDLGSANESLGRMKAQLEKSATQLTGAERKTAEALALVTERMQTLLRDYEVQVAKLTEAEVFSFKLSEKSKIEEHRELVRKFMSSNEALSKLMRDSESVVRVELARAGVPEKAVEATVRGFVSSQVKLRPLQMRIRGADEVLGNSALSILELLESNWGKWSHDETTGAPVFQSEALLATYNGHIEKIQAAAADQAKAQEELVRVMRAP